MTGNGEEISLSEIMADESKGSEVSQEQQNVETPVETAEAGQARDDKGRFAAKTEEVEATEQPVDKTGTVPQQALHAAREKEREARTENESLKRALDEMRGQISLLMQQGRQPQPAKQEEQKKPDFWENPDDFVSSKLSTVEQKLAQQAERISVRLAVKEHGKETVEAAYAALGTALQQGDRSAHEAYRAIKESDDPYEEIVQWHKRTQNMKRVGNDPDAWLEAEMEKRLNDPAYQAKIIERIQGAAAANTDRSSPVTKFPQSLSRLPTSGGNAEQEADMSDAGIFKSAMRR